MFNLLINFYYTILESIQKIFFFLNFFLNLHSNDAPYPWQIAFQDPASPGFTGIFDLHDSIFFFLVIILLGVIWVLSSLFSQFKESINKLSYKYLTHGTTVELV